MKNLLKLLVALLAINFIVSCGKDDNNQPAKVIYKPRLIASGIYYSEITIFDTRNTANVKQYNYSWSNLSHKFEYSSTIDTTTTGDFRHYFSKNWVSTLTDPVLTGGPSGLHVQDRATNNKTYWIFASSNPLYATATSTMTSDHISIPNAWTNAGVIDGYANSYEQYNSSSYFNSKLFFDLDGNKYIINRDEENVESGTISDFVKTPLGNMSSHNIDFSLADAVFYLYSGVDSRYPNETLIYFLDYETMQYVLVSRKENLTTVNSKNILRTTSWQPISDLVDTWNIDLD